MKQQKNLKSKKTESVQIKSHTDELSKLFKIVLGIIVLFAIFYLITYYVTENKKDTAKDNTNGEKAVIQYDEIMIGTLLTQYPESYYVMIEKSDDVYKSTYEQFMKAYTGTDNKEHLKVYTASLDNGLNNQYRGEENNFDFETIQEFRLKETALIKVSDGKIDDYYVGSTDIINHLKEITK